MDGLKEKISQAKTAGYKDEEILQFLSQMPDVGPKIATAVENQYKPSEILSFLGESKAYQAGKRLSKLERGIVSALSGPTFGFADELAGAIGAPMLAYQKCVPLSDAYTMGRDIFRGAAESYQKEAPIAAAAGQMAASLPMIVAGVPGKIAQEVGTRAMPAIRAVAPSAASALT